MGKTLITIEFAWVYSGFLFGLIVFATIQALAATRLLPQGKFANHHGPIGALTHVIDSQSGNAARMQGFHLDSRAVNSVDLSLDGNGDRRIDAVGEVGWPPRPLPTRRLAKPINIRVLAVVPDQITPLLSYL